MQGHMKKERGQKMKGPARQARETYWNSHSEGCPAEMESKEPCSFDLFFK